MIKKTKKTKNPISFVSKDMSKKTNWVIQVRTSDDEEIVIRNQNEKLSVERWYPVLEEDEIDFDAEDLYERELIKL